jgi:hypothetical protein
LNIHLAETPNEPCPAVGQEPGCSSSKLNLGSFGPLFFPRATRSSQANKTKPKDDDDFKPNSDEESSSSSEDEKPKKKLPPRCKKNGEAQPKKDVQKGGKKG